MDERDSARERLLYHGGNLAAAAQAFPFAARPWIDLSTGINPHPYPVPALPPEAFTRLPDPEQAATLEAIAARAYGAGDPAGVVAAPGTQAILQWLPRLLPARRVAVLDFTYAEHARQWAATGAAVETVDSLDALTEADVAVVVNPNNPDGRLVPVEALAALAARMARRGSTLVVDEAFADALEPAASLVPHFPERGCVVLRSFGKIYGLAGVRLGFAIASPELAARLRAALGPWAVSGPALAIGRAALADVDWLGRMRARLGGDAARLDGLLAGAGCEVVGGTPLFRLTRAHRAPALFTRLAEAGILVRPFAERPEWLRFGLPADEPAWNRLTEALRTFRGPENPSVLPQ